MTQQSSQVDVTWNGSVSKQVNRCIYI